MTTLARIRFTQNSLTLCVNLNFLAECMSDIVEAKKKPHIIGI